jgi:hypothetical protein
MNLDNPKGAEPTVSAKTKVRRTFLKRATAGAVLTSLPTHSVWGAVCSVSGAMSGNLSGIQRHKDCEKPSFPNPGRSPGTWKNLVEFQSEKLHGVFLEAPGPGGPQADRELNDAKRQCLMQHIRDVSMLNSSKLIRNSRLDLVNSSFVINVYDALDSNGGGDGSLEFNLAGVWLNCYFGLYNPNKAGNKSWASKQVEQLVAWMVTQANAGLDSSLLDSDYNFNEGTTEYSLPSCDALTVADLPYPAPT